MKLFDKIKEKIQAPEDININVKESLNETKNNLITMFNGEGTNMKVKIPYNCLGFFGCAGGVGTTTLCWETAKMLYNQGYTVCLLDMNLMQPSLYSKHISKRMKDSLKTYLDGGCELGDILSRDNEGIDFVEINPFSITDYAEYDTKENYEAMTELVNSLKKVYDIVIVDFEIKQFFHEIVQGTLKETTNLIGVVNDSVSSQMNREVCENIIASTSIIKPIYIANNINGILEQPEDVKVVIPHEDNMLICERMATSFIEKGSTDDELVITAFQQLLEEVYKEVGIGDYLAQRASQEK